MNALKHMELIFGAALVFACGVAFMPPADNSAAPRAASPGAQAAQPASAAMPVVVVKGKRMSALEKRASLSAEAGAPPQANDG